MLIAGLSAAASQLSAEPRVGPPLRPYHSVGIEQPGGADDPSLKTFRETLATVARRRIYAELAPLVLTPGFFWGRDFKQQFDPQRAAVENLAAAVALEQNDARGWAAIARFAGEAATESLESRPGVVCAPAEPRFDVAALSKLLDDTGTTLADWTYPRGDAVVAREKAEDSAAPVATLTGAFVRLLDNTTRVGDAAPSPDGWSHIRLADSSTGYVLSDSLNRLGHAKLCYGKDALGLWRIAGFIGVEP